MAKFSKGIVAAGVRQKAQKVQVAADKKAAEELALIVPKTAAQLIAPPRLKPSNPTKIPDEPVQIGARVTERVPAKMKELVFLARENTELAIETIIGIMTCPDTPRKVRLEAANMILDRGYGKPASQVKVGGEIEHRHRKVEDISTDELERLVSRNVEASKIIDSTLRPAK